MNLCSIYHHEIPTFIQEFANTPSMLRLKKVGMHCGCEYTNFAIFRNLDKYTRYDHSLGVALIIYHFTQDIKQSIAGLFHDIASPSFSHVIDFLNNDHLTQESTEDGTYEIIEKDAMIQQLLHKYHLTTADVYDYHMYPIADNDTTLLSADRLEYTLNNMINFDYTDIESISAIYQNIIVSTNEYDEIELQFKDVYYANIFALGSLYCSKIYVSDADRYSMQYLAELLKAAIEYKIIQYSDLYQDEPYIIHKLETSILQTQWNQFKQLTTMDTKTTQSNEYYRKIFAKKRYINPYIQNNGRLTSIDTKYAHQLQQFLDYSFDYWVLGR